MSNAAEHNLCEISATSSFSCRLWDKDRNYNRFSEAQSNVQLLHVNTRVVQIAETTKQDIYSGLPAERSESKNRVKSIGLCILLQQVLEKVLGYLLDLIVLAHPLFGGNMGQSWVFFARQG